MLLRMKSERSYGKYQLIRIEWGINIFFVCSAGFVLEISKTYLLLTSKSTILIATLKSNDLKLSQTMVIYLTF